MNIIDEFFQKLWNFRAALVDGAQYDEARFLEAITIGYDTVRTYREHIAAGRVNGRTLYEGSSIPDALREIEHIARNLFTQVCHEIVKSANPLRVVALARRYPEYAIGAHSAVYALLVGPKLKRGTVCAFDRE